MCYLRSIALLLTTLLGISAAEVVTIEPGDDVAQIVADNPEGTTFLFKAGEHRGATCMPKSNQRFIGELGAVLNGAVELTGTWTQQGDYWTYTFPESTDEVPDPRYPTGDNRMDTDACSFGDNMCRTDEVLIVEDTIMYHLARDMTQFASGRPETFAQDLEWNWWYYDIDSRTIYVRKDLNDAKVEMMMTPAFISTSVRPCHNVLVRNLTIEKYACSAQYGAINSRQADSVNTGWTIEYCEFRYNHGMAISITKCDSFTIRRNWIHHQGQMGFGGGGPHLLFEENELAFNNVLGFSAGWESGATKFVFVTDAVVKSNYAHHNYLGNGLWHDIPINKNSLVRGNVCDHNGGSGIFQEIDNGSRVVCNISRFNGREKPWVYATQIHNSCSRDIEIDSNLTVTDTGKTYFNNGNYWDVNGINTSWQTIGCDGPADNRMLLVAVSNVHHNHIVFLGTTGSCGFAADQDVPEYKTCGDGETYALRDSVISFWNQNRSDYNSFHAPQSRTLQQVAGPGCGTVHDGIDYCVADFEAHSTLDHDIDNPLYRAEGEDLREYLDDSYPCPTCVEDLLKVPLGGEAGPNADAADTRIVGSGLSPRPSGRSVGISCRGGKAIAVDGLRGSSAARLVICDLSGRTVREFRLSGDGARRTVSFGALAAGVYCARAYTAGTLRASARMCIQ
ncbi:MAG: hypothetical protein GF418_04505 [Chitinivibrionales bacterium]|nr:hypothetical protein [Chitinivibrionales bacterium]MBD3394869.1 hypothetical protein [Chitinivibrionales bacterium]